MENNRRGYLTNMKNVIAYAYYYSYFYFDNKK